MVVELSAEDPSITLTVRRIVLVDEVVRQRKGRFHSNSLEGHLLHVNLSGEVQQKAEGRPEHFGPNTVVWYHHNEPVEGHIISAPWRFITINFDGPSLPPPPEDRRVIPAGPGVIRNAKALLRHWRDAASDPLRREILAFRTLGDLLLELCESACISAIPSAPYPANARDRWWEAEKKLRRMLDQPLPLEVIAAVVGMSERTTIRACKSATGQPPASRVRELRIAHATHLLQHSRLPITEIAARVGFERVQEFSRDYKRRTGRTPSQARAALPDYLKRT